MTSVIGSISPRNQRNYAWLSILLSTTPNLTYHDSYLYPFLFDLQTKERRHYSQVQCHQRLESKDACDYYHPQMRNLVDERPCWLSYNCRNKTNSFHGNRLEECSSYYQCKDVRIIRWAACLQRMRFSDTYKTCVLTLANCEHSIIS